MFRQKSLCIGAALFCAFSWGAAFAQQPYPNRPIRVILPIAPGSSTDTEGRVVLNEVSRTIGQPIVMEYKPSGNSLLGMDYVAKSPPDGYTFLLMSAAFSLVPLTEGQLPFDGLNAFTPVSLLAKKWGVLAENPAFPPNNATEFVAYAKAHPGQINFATSGAGKGQHLTGAWIQSLTGIDVTYVHYKGGGPALNDLFADRVQIIPMALSTAAPLAKAGKIKLLGMANLTRNPAYPDISTLNEQGWKDFEYISWMGMSAPAKTPAANVAKMSAEINKAVKSPEVVKRLGAENELIGSTPEEFQQVINDEIETWRKIIQQQHIKINLE